jgi:hypothetical protein
LNYRGTIGFDTQKNLADLRPTSRPSCSLRVPPAPSFQMKPLANNMGASSYLSKLLNDGGNVYGKTVGEFDVLYVIYTYIYIYYIRIYILYYIYIYILYIYIYMM